jgi:uncharacterized protein YecE (DUF72 family)
VLLTPRAARVNPVRAKNFQHDGKPRPGADLPAARRRAQAPGMKPARSPAPGTAAPPAVRVGCCGFAGAQAAYFRDFPVVEVQQTFYDPPAPETAARWRERAPPDFEFTLKAWQLITHPPGSPTYRRLRQPLPVEWRDQVGAFRPSNAVWAAWERTREITRLLRARVVVFQCPASFAPTPEHLENLRRFVRRVRADLEMRHEPAPRLAWEPRGAWPDAVIEALCRELDLVHVVDPWVRPPVTPDPFYFRLHGLGGYGHRYTDAELRWLRARVGDFPAGGWCLFNNVTMREDAARFLELLRGGRAAPRAAAGRKRGKEEMPG